MLAEFYKDCEIFITGGSGVVGKAGIEKLLRSCDVRKIYILLRNKKGENVEERLEKLKKAKIFRVLKSQKPKALNKLVAIPGDATLPNLGITPHYAKLMENVSVFFHCAATVRFNDSLKAAMRLNVGGTWEALKFAETLKNLKMYVHVSTFFSNPYLEKVESKMYSSPMNWKQCLEMVENETNEELMDILTKKIIVGFPNTYCFTKNLAESVVADYLGRIPVTIFRPSIVIAATGEPEPGFPPSLMGAMGLFAAIGAGLLKTVYMDTETFLDILPQDMCAIGMLCSALLAHRKFETGTVTEVPVLLASTFEILSFTIYNLYKMMETQGIWHEFAFDKSFLIPGAHLTSNRYVYIIKVFTQQIFPALLGDALLKLFGQKPVLMGLVRKAYTSLEVMKPFLFNVYKSDNKEKLPEVLEITDGTEFDFNDILHTAMNANRTEEACRDLLAKIREVLLKENPSTIPRAKKILKIKIILYNILRAWLAYYLLRLFYRIFMESVEHF